MIAFLARRIVHALITWIVAVALIFIAMRMLPGNPLLSRFGQHPDAAQMARLREENGWDRPLLVQLGQFFWQLATTGDLGESIARGGTSIGRELRERIPATVELTLAAIIVAIPLGIAAGVVAARFAGRLPDHLVSALSLLGVSVPVFFIGIMLWQLFPSFPTSQRLPAYVFDFEPITGLYLLDAILRGRFELLPLALKHLFLPALTLATVPMASITKITRSAMLEASKADYMRTARAKGASAWRTILRHALPNAAVPITNIAGLQIGMLLTGAVITESVFAWPGLGKYIADAVVNDKDYAVVQAGAIVIAAMFVSMNLLLDLAYLALDPRIQFDDRGAL